MKMLNHKIYTPKFRVKTEAPFLYAGGYRTFANIEDGLILGLNSEGPTSQAALVDSKSNVISGTVSPPVIGKKHLEHHMEWLPKMAEKVISRTKKKISAISVQLGPGNEASLMIGLKFAKVSASMINLQRNWQENSRYR